MSRSHEISKVAPKEFKKLNIVDSKKLSVHYDEDKKSYDF
jgi:hypothetical protein